MNILHGLQNFLQLINDNWTSIMVLVGLMVGIVQKTHTYLTKTKEERVRIAKAQIRERLLTMITDAETNYDDWNNAGAIKRSQVIDGIYKDYPILSKVSNQKNLVKWIDGEIDNSLKTLETIVKSNGYC